MQTKLIFNALISTSALTLFAWTLIGYGDDKVQPIPDEPSKERTPNQSLFMQAKMSASQRVLEGLLNKDFQSIETAATSLGELADAVPSPKEDQKEKIFDHFRIEFMRQSTHLQKMARDQNFEGAAFVYQTMTSTCIACHQHLRDVK